LCGKSGGLQKKEKDSILGDNLTASESSGGNFSQRPFWYLVNLISDSWIKLSHNIGTMKAFVVARHTQLKFQERESGTVQEDTEFTKAVDCWIEVEKRLERDCEEGKKSQTSLDREAEEAAMHRANLLRSAHLKRRWSSSSASSNATEELFSDTERSVYQIQILLLVTNWIT
jgi:hypothetical protein